MAVITATNYTATGVYANAGASGLSFVKQAGNRRFGDRAQSGQSNDKYGLTAALSRLMPPVTLDISPTAHAGSTAFPAAKARTTGLLDSFLRTPFRDTFASNAVYGPFTPSSASIRGGASITRTASAIRPSSRFTASGIGTYRRISASSARGINTLA